MSQFHISSSEAAEIIGVSIHTFRSKRNYLRTINFPEPLPWNKRRYNRQSVIDWFEVTQKAGSLPDPLFEFDNVTIHPAAKRVTILRCAKKGQNRANQRRQSS